ncbi:MAG: hypothetical protein KAG28_05230 [Cocleimonas sp.]|nr:hypothetical protein [Cocleimonas sp.]
MFNQSSKKPLVVELMDISQQNEAILKFFISGVGNKVFKIGENPSEVEAYIIDYDFPGAEAHWKREYASSHRPRIILSTYDPQAENAVWVSKPLSSKNLIAAALSVSNLLKATPSSPSIRRDKDPDGLRETMPQKPVLATPITHLDQKTNAILPKKAKVQEQASVASLVSETAKSAPQATQSPSEIAPIHNEVISPKTVIPQVANKEAIAAKIARKKKRWNELCGENEDTNSFHQDELRYTPEHHFISKLVGGVRLAKQSQQVVEIKSSLYSVHVLPNEHQVFTEFSIQDKSFVEFSKARIGSNDITLHILSSIETDKLALQMSRQPEYIHSLEYFLWTSSLLVSQGRLPATLDINKKTVLKYWPSFARVEAFPYSMRIAALWHYSPDTLVEMANKLEIPQRYVFAFYNGAEALDLVEQNPKKVKQQMKAKPKKKGSGLISRLFKRLLHGGGS